MPLMSVDFGPSAGFVRSLLRMTESHVPASELYAVAVGQNDCWCVPFVCIKRTSGGGADAAEAKEDRRKTGTASVEPAALSRSLRENCGRALLIGPPCAR